MELPTISMEVERLMNLVRGFGWEMRKQSISEGEISIELVKKTVVASETGEVSPT